MGVIITPPIDPPDNPDGDLCENWWGVGKVWAGFPTPASFLCSFSGFQHGQDWIPIIGELNDFNATCLQSSIVPCFFSFPQPFPLFRSIVFNLSGVDVIYTHQDFGVIFSGVGVVGQTLINNTVDDIFTGGSCKMYLP